MQQRIKRKLDSYCEMSKKEQIETVKQELEKEGFERNKIISSHAYVVNAYMREDVDYVVVDIVSTRDHLKDSLCIMNREDFMLLQGMYFSNSLRGKKGSKRRPRIQVTGNYEGNHLSGANVCEMVCPKTKGQVIDHKFHNTMINTREALRACTVKENNMNKKKCKNPANPEYAYKPEEDFATTWFVYVYWRVLDLISQEEAFAYNLEKNS